MSNTPSLAGPLEKLQQIKNNPVEVIKMYNMYKDGVKNYLSQKKQGLSEIKKFTIKSEDKAAFINRLEKLGIAIDSYAIEDDKLNGTFSIEFIDPQAIDMVNQVLRRSSKINQVKSPKSVYTDKKANGKGSALKEVENPKDVIKLDVPLFIRLLEYAREDAKTDMDLHDVAENIISMASEGRTLNMNDYNKIIGVGELDRGDSVKCKILTVNGEEETISFSLEDVGEEVGLNEDTGGICRAIDSRGVIYEMECTLFNTGLDGYYITDVDGDTLTVAN